MRVDDDNCFVSNTCCASLLVLQTESDLQIRSGILGKAACADMPLKSRSISAVWSSVSIFLIEATLLE